MIRIGIDVGGTFTDLVAVDDAAAASTLAKAALHPARPLARGDRRARPARRRRSALDLARAAGPDRPHRARHDRRHQRAARAQGRPGRPADDRGPSRRHRDARGAEGRSLQPAHAAACAARAARACASACASGCAPTAASRSPLDRGSLDAAIAMLRARAGRGGGGLLPARLARPASTSATRPRRVARALPGRLRLAVVRGPAADQGVRARLDDGRQRLCRPGAGRAISPGSTPGCARPATRRRC